MAELRISIWSGIAFVVEAPEGRIVGYARCHQRSWICHPEHEWQRSSRLSRDAASVQRCLRAVEKRAREMMSLADQRYARVVIETTLNIE